jgi:hypothetical protein
MAEPERQQSFFEPLWRRVAVVVMVAAWLAFEVFYSQDSFWISIAAGMLVYGIWSFFLNWPKTSGGSLPK